MKEREKRFIFFIFWFGLELVVDDSGIKIFFFPRNYGGSGVYFPPSCSRVFLSVEKLTYVNGKTV